MDELIRRGDLLKPDENSDKILIIGGGNGSGKTLAMAEALMKRKIETVPAVDAVEVVHGRWKYYHKQNIAVCTNCSFERDLDANFGKAVSCPNCGAKMDGE